MNNFIIKNYNKNIFYNVANFTIILFPLFLLTGPLISELFMFILISCFFILKANNLKFIFSEKEFKIFILFWITILTSSFLSGSYEAFFKSFAYLRFGLFFIAIKFFLMQNSNILKKLKIVFMIIFGLLFVDTVYQHINRVNLLGYVAIDYPRLSSVFNEEYILGSYTARLMPLFLAVSYFVLIDNINKLKSYFIIIFFFACSLIIFLAGERVALFYLMLILISLIIILAKIKNYKILSILFFLILSQFSLLYFNKDFKSRYLQQTLDEFGMSSDKTYQKEYGTAESIYKNIYIYSPAHQSYILTAYNMFLDKPFFGHGIKSFRVKCNNIKFADNLNSCSTHPHNIYFELLSETGIFSFILISFVYFLLLKKFFLNIFIIDLKKIKICSTLLSLFFIFSLFPFIPSGSFFNNWLSMIMFYNLGFLNFFKNQE